MTRLLMSSRPWLWTVFVAVHVWLAWLAVAAPGQTLGDVHLYAWWVGSGVQGGPWVGIDTEWVYPLAALAPMLVAGALGGAAYPIAWLVLVTLLDCVALAVLVGRRDRPRMLLAAWWWTAFLLAVGPIALARIDSVTVPLAVMAVALLARRPFVAGVLLAVATWMKVWPAAVIGAVVIASRHRWRVIAAGVATSVVVIGVGLVLGAGTNLASFVTMQTGRGIQIEAPVAAPWVWAGALGAEHAGIYYDDELFTFQVFGLAASAVSDAMTPLLVIAVLGIIAAAVWAMARGARGEAVVPPLALALVTAFIVVNKVGSPQFITWLAPVIVFGIIAGRARSFRAAGALVLVIAALTQVVYPVLYGHLLGLALPMVTVLTLRNILLLVLLAMAVQAMLRLRSRAGLRSRG